MTLLVKLNGTHLNRVLRGLKLSSNICNPFHNFTPPILPLKLKYSFNYANLLFPSKVRIMLKRVFNSKVSNSQL